MSRHAAAAPLDPFQVDLERFQGPLDLLLHLIRTQDIDIFDIPIARITAQFLEAVRGAPSLELERAGEFLEMASTLMRIKLRMLFPHHGAEDESGDDPRADLVRRLLEYEHFREAAERLEAAERARGKRFARGYRRPRPVAGPADVPLRVSWEDVWSAAMGMTERSEAARPEIRLAGRPVPVDGKIDAVLEALRGTTRVEFSALVAPWDARTHSVAALLACLELAKRNRVRIRQTHPFAPLWILRAQPVP